MKNLLFFSFALFFLISCETKPKETLDSTKIETKDESAIDSIEQVKIEKDPKTTFNKEFVAKNNKIVNQNFNDFARFIAGMPSKTPSPLDSLRATEEWKSFATSFDSSWKLIEKNRLNKMASWSDEEFATLKSKPIDVLYPFSGPDFVNVFTFFPNGKTYVLMALEPVGEYTDFSYQNTKFVKKYLSSVDNSLNDLFKKSYFITMHMIGDLQKDKVNGVLPLICLFMARTGNEILDINRVELSADGAVNLDSLVKKDNKKKVTGIKIDFVDLKHPTVPKTLFYFRADLSDGGLKANPAMTNFLDKFNHTIGYFKSASYLGHMKEFATIRSIMLEKCDYVVQDDTGIAYRFFDKNIWDFQLYGKYVKPVKDFSGVDQPDLRKKYESDSTVKPLPFSLGYHWGTQNQNLMKMTKKGI
ncbi:MAG: hypothetical protein SNJ77_04465 [Cytophagales bacterium]